MKYLSALFFTVALIWTWNIVHSTPRVSFETHSGIQERMADFLRGAVKSQKPDASEVSIEKIWTENLANGKVKAHFTYSFKSPDAPGSTHLTLTHVSGEGLLERKDDDNSGYDRWSLTEIKTNNNQISFEEAELVSPSPQ